MTADAADSAPRKHSLEGVWIVMVDPGATPAGDPPPFESTLAYDDSHVVNEITSRAGSSSAGLGRWRRTGSDTFVTSWHKYRFDGSGAYIGKTVIREEIRLGSKSSYTARSVTRVMNPAGVVVAQFESEAVGTRMGT